MNIRKITAALISAMMCIPLMHISTGAEENADTKLIDSGISYTESTETINNPGAGYTSTLWYTCKPGDTPVYSPTGNLVLMFINIGGFSCGANGTTDDDGNYTEGTDYDLDSTFFENLRKTFDNCRKNGCTIAVRFRYDANGKSNPEPATFEKVLSHISQIKNDGILEDYKDILMYVESGFVGAWGEQHSGKYTSLEYKAQLLSAMLDCVPAPIPVTVRTPNIFAKWADIPVSEIDQYVSAENSDASRIGLYNDGYMGSDSDLGTYSNRERETTWLHNQTFTSYYGGEFSGNLDWAKKYTTYLPENAIPEMYKTHLSYINANIYNLYKDYTYSSDYNTTYADNSAYYGQTVFKFIRDHIGYRFVLRDSKLSQSVEKGGQLDLDFTVENTGFANPIRKQKAEIILEKGGNYVVTQADIDTTKWHSCEKSNEKISLKIPGELEEGDWNVYLRLSVGNSSVKDSYMRTVEFANNDIWNPASGANRLGTFSVTDTDNIDQLTDNNFMQTNNVNAVENSDGEMFTTNNHIIVDGTRSGDSEWTDSLLCEQTDNKKVYISADEKNLYIMAEIEQNAASPVYNLQVKHSGETYWLYYMSNGFVYYNKGSYTGCICKHIGKYVEFKIPFGDVMGLASETFLDSVRISIQDSSDSWKNVGEITATNYAIPKKFDIYSAHRTVNVKENDSLTLNTEVSPENSAYQWYFNDEPLENQTGQRLNLENISQSDKGMYSVEITSPEGIVKRADICSISEVYSGNIMGDADGNGKLEIADIVLIQKYLVKKADITDINFINSDMDSSGNINIFDLINIKRLYK